MSQAQSTRFRSPSTLKRFSFAKRLKEIDMFFQGKDPVHQTMRRTARRLRNQTLLTPSLAAWL
jgi:hypothetical protein